MKKLFLALTTLAFSSISSAGSVKAYTAVLALDRVKCLAVIEKIELKSTFRCPECYEFVVQGRKEYADQNLTELLVTTYIDAESKEVVAKVEYP